ncbi:MAG: class I SAM-dependent methyltransferase [Halorhodospira halophila]|uniref:class I SAM-dependent methyltransferase n=1 Tax=Halorhodospira TaxID=85108 RepID=UPI001913C4CC|nr:MULTISPECIES: class I SAM-dependent methyltransferase [Halorhodospira]MBK5935614.1 SAM-dependent methyltransferase [Halorhodospira halophila]MBK5943092.1 SAM-dependent methyltransferase [Halorhodospira halophila]MCC3750859.1 class I SAM-dependent methyltransferase [Halorhodospira halophila]MCG5533772.1 class I SAM-dependent methyltransferase [Halorhodospira sp. 9621]MCG5539192.1 class I SAM-dependent methyltransferase [Halorhodospira sp. 9622]
MDLSSIRNAYRRYARYYDGFFGRIFAPGRKFTMQYLNAEPDRRILEVGVGTGISLPEYRRDVSIVGVDVSPDMLDIAHRRVAEQGLEHVESLHEMDAEALDFPDDSFDVVVAMYVASVVPNPDRLVDECRRVCRPGGEIFIINHFASQHPVVRGFEKTIRPLSKLLGFRTDMELDDLPQRPGFECLGVHPAYFFGYWKLVHYRNGSSAESAPVEEPEEELATAS